MKDKHIIIGVSGGIAAYKAAVLIRLLIKKGAAVKVIMTNNATEFITPLTLSTLSKNPVLIDFFDKGNGNWNSHVDLGIWADLFIIAPATATTIGKMANGIADNLLLTTYLSSRCPVMIAPSMDLDMLRHPSTKKNLECLQLYGNIIIEPESGELASGLEGKGRMADPEHIFKNISRFFETEKKFEGKKILVTAGPTFEPIDPVRYIGNRSSGKMGYAIASELAAIGFNVTLVSGPVNLTVDNKNIRLLKVNTAEEMFNACSGLFESMDAAILSAAVSDYKVLDPSETKIKRSMDNLKLDLHATKDIAAHLGSVKRDNQVLVGFALETNDEFENAKKKLLSKNFDFIVLNSLKDAGAGFNSDSNIVTILDKNENVEKTTLKSKTEIAKDIIQKLITYF